MVAGVLRLGFLYPGHAAEDDYPLLAAGVRPPVDAQVVHTSVGEDAHRVDALMDLGSTARLRAGADELRRRGVAAATWACTSGSFVFGLDGARRQVAEIEAELGIPVTSTSLAFVSAAAALGVTRLAVAATYPEDVTRCLVEFLGDAGIEVVRLGSGGIITAVEVGTLGRRDVLRMVAEHDHPGAEAIAVPDTALHTAAWLEELEAAAGKPVLTANQVTMWDVLRVARHPAVGDGLGELFRVGAASSRA